MNSLLKLLPVMIRLSGDNEQVREQAVFAAWRAAAGEGVANVCEPSRLHNKNLTVAVLDPQPVDPNAKPRPRPAGLRH